MDPRRMLRLLLGLALLPVLLPAMEPYPRTRDPLTDMAISPALFAYARSHSIPLHGIELTGETEPPRKGDETIFLLSLQEGRGFKQWLVRLRYDDLNPRKNETRPLPADTMFTSTGLELTFVNTPAALAVQLIGPFLPGEETPGRISLKSGRALVGAESLQQGMDQYARSSLAIAARLKAAGIGRPNYGGSSRRPSAKEVESGRHEAATFQLTPEEERLAFSVFFSLRSFFTAANEIPACREILEQVVQKPSLWSIAGNLGVGANFEYGWQEVETVAEDPIGLHAPAYRVPVRVYLNGKPAVKSTIIVSTTRPPLRTSAGIVAICAEHPTEEGRRLFLRLLSARRQPR